MAVEEDKNKKDESKGFAGLSSLVSDVDTSPLPAAKKEPDNTSEASLSPPLPTSLTAQPQPRQEQTYQEPPQPSSGSSGGKWLVGIIVVIGLFFLLASLSNNTTTPITPAFSPATQTPNFDHGTAPGKSAELAPPKFNEYSSEIYDGPRANVKLTSEFDKNFRTRIRNTQSQSVNFAGEYVLSTWGCGMSCLMGVAVNARTGHVIGLPGSVCCWKGVGESVIYRKNSRLLVLAGLINEDGQYGTHFYHLINDKFVHIKTIPIKDQELSSTSSTLAAVPSSPAYSLHQEQPQEQARPIEDKPPVDSNLVLSFAQIRYCLAEDIRLSGAKAAVNNYIDADVDRFNAMVADYNSRCGSFRYRRGVLESARTDIEPYRSQLQREGRSRFTGPPSGSVSTPGSWALNDPAVREVLPRSAPTTTKPPPVPPSPSVQRSGPPTNSWVSGSNWYCNDGFRKVGDQCDALKVPANAWISGSNWYCNDGYRKVGERCERLNVPRNAWVSGSNWYCNDGSRKVGDQCEAFNAPDNAWVSGSNWYCNDGYRKVGDRCVSIFER